MVLCVHQDKFSFYVLHVIHLANQTGLELKERAVCQHHLKELKGSTCLKLKTGTSVVFWHFCCSDVVVLNFLLTAQKKQQRCDETWVVGKCEHKKKKIVGMWLH